MKKRIVFGCLAVSLLILGGCTKKEIKSEQRLIEGEQTFQMELGSLEENGLSQIIDTLQKYVEIAEIRNVAYFQADVDKKGAIKSFHLTLEGFNAQKEFIGNYRFQYEKNKSKLDYSAPKDSDKIDGIVVQYNETYDPSYLSKQVSRIPVKAQIAMLDFSNYAVEFQKNTQISGGTPVMNGQNGETFPILSYEEYLRGTSDVSTGTSTVVATLSDGTGPTSQNQMYYVLKTKKGAKIQGNQETTMQHDYWVNGDKISFTRDYGENWIPADISGDELQKTLAFYGGGIAIPEGSYYISDDPNGIVGFFYGENPILKLSKDGGQSWKDVPFDHEYVRQINRRVIHFFDAQTGYAALGTDWSMGTGSEAAVYFTNDGGETWEKTTLPDFASHTLTGAAFTDQRTGMISLEHLDESWPYLQLTLDGGKTTQEVLIPWDALPESITFLNKVDSFTVENGIYTLALGQGNYGNMQVIYTAEDPAGPWSYQDSGGVVKHNAG